MDTKGFWGAVGLALMGVIIADLVTHGPGVQAGGAALDSVLKTTYSGMLGGVAVA